MPQYTEKPVLSTILLAPDVAKLQQFIVWQASFNERIVEAPGFISIEFLNHEKDEKASVVQRFTTNESSKAWHTSEAYLRLIKELDTFATGIEITNEEEISHTDGVTEIIVTQVLPKNAAAFRIWNAKIHQEEGKFKGFRGVYLQSPTTQKGTTWITMLQFDNLENLDKWLLSTIRKKLLNEASSFIDTIESHRVISSYAGWFANIAKVAEVPPVWKQSMVVLLVLFPVVMLELRYLLPLLQPLNRTLSTFIANTISVALLSFPMMPIAITLLKWWLYPQKAASLAITLFGTLVLFLLYSLEIYLLWDFAS